MTYSDDFSSEVGESSLCHDSPPAKETTFGAADTIVLNERARVVPVTETKTIVTGSTSEVKNDTKDLKPHKSNQYKQISSILGAKNPQ